MKAVWICGPLKIQDIGGQVTSVKCDIAQEKCKNEETAGKIVLFDENWELGLLQEQKLENLLQNDNDTTLGRVEVGNIVENTAAFSKLVPYFFSP